MKTLLLVITFLINIQLSWAQLKRSAACPVFLVDVLDGNVNKLSTKSTMGELKKTFPCFTEIVEEATPSNCAGIFYKEYGIYFYTGRNYFEIRENFKGKLSLPLLGANRKSLFKLLGNPAIKDISWDAFKTKYGTLVLYYNKAGRINKLQISNKSTETLKLCE